MHQKKRLILFYSFCALFAAAGTIIVFYALGWRLNFDNFKIQKIGAIYIKTQPRDVVIKINGKVYPDFSSVIQSGTLVSDLLPKTYRVEIEKERYSSYNKTLKVQPSAVEEIINIVLVPKNPKIEKIFLSIKGNVIIDVSNDGKFIIKNTENGSFYLYDISKPSSTLNIKIAISNIKKSAIIKNAVFVPFKTSQLIVDDNDILKLFDFENSKLETISGAAETWTLVNPNLYIIETNNKNSRALYSFNLIFKAKTIIADLPKEISKLDKIKISGNNIAALSSANGNLYILKNSRSPEKISRNVKLFAFSPDNKKIAILKNDGLINVLFLEDFNSDIKKKAGDVINFSLSDMSKIKNLEWRKDSFHLLVDYGYAVKLVEIDDRPELNSADIISGISSYYYNNENNIFYFIENNALKRIDFSE
ncbi:MAG: hypothetical protein QMD86_01770 [Patescibacteria group bacterium]|nr:hypothetical protein [Patescibacteria group bacterium]